jgi:hypothetical protein
MRIDNTAGMVGGAPFTGKGKRGLRMKRFYTLNPTKMRWTQ